MANRTLLTWNLKHDAAPLALIVRYVRHLRGRGHDYVVALQESPEAADDVRARTGGHAYGNGPLVLLSSQPLSSSQYHNRFVMGMISFGGLDLAVFNYHGHSRAERLEAEARGGFASELRWIFDNLAGSREILVLGDFNAQPNDPEVAHCACF